MTIHYATSIIFSLSLCFSGFLSLCLSLILFVSVSLCLCICLSPDSLSVSVSICLFVSLSLCPSPHILFLSFIQIYSAGSGLEGALGNGKIQSSEMTVKVDTTDTFTQVRNILNLNLEYKMLKIRI